MQGHATRHCCLGAGQPEAKEFFEEVLASLTWWHLAQRRLRPLPIVRIRQLKMDGYHMHKNV